MSENDDLEHIDDEHSTDGPKGLRDALARTQQEAQEASARAEKLAQENAYLIAGITLTNPDGTSNEDAAVLLERGVDAETAARLLKASVVQEPAIPQAEAAGLQRIAESGGEPPAPIDTSVTGELAQWANERRATDRLGPDYFDIAEKMRSLGVEPSQAGVAEKNVSLGPGIQPGQPM